MTKLQPRRASFCSPNNELGKPLISLFRYGSLHFRYISFYNEPEEGFRFVILLFSLYFRYISLLDSNWPEGVLYGHEG